MKIKNIETYKDFKNNHEIWYVCKNCHYQFDLRKEYKCPHCGKYPENQ